MLADDIFHGWVVCVVGGAHGSLSRAWHNRAWRMVKEDAPSCSRPVISGGRHMQMDVLPVGERRAAA